MFKVSRGTCIARPPTKHRIDPTKCANKIDKIYSQELQSARLIQVKKKKTFLRLLSKKRYMLKHTKSK